MVVEGDRVEAVAPRKGLRAVTAALKAAEEAGPGARRHDLLISAFLQAAGLAQGLADAEFEAKGYDDLSPSQDAAMTLLIAMAKKVAASAWSDFAASGPPVALELMALALQPAPDMVSVTTPEGYAFYAVYPEAYLKAAIEPGWSSPPLVIGLRSIGTGLAALVGAAAQAKTVVTLRPTGAPPRREVRVSDALRGVLAAHEGPFAVVDEGPGPSGSSFGVVADLLESLGVAGERIIFLPSHSGDLGPQASEAHRARWAGARRQVATFDDLLGDEPLAGWFSPLIGEVEFADDISGGFWRKAAGWPAERWPPVNAAQERRKFRLHTASGRWLAKFAGLGPVGEGKFERAQQLHRAGFSPEPLALRRGFLLERWEAGSPGVGDDRAEFVEHLGRYLGFRAAAFPASYEQGASLGELAEMARVNGRELLGHAEAAPLLAQIASRLRHAGEAFPVHVDGRLHPWEWLHSTDDLLLKTDALDHSEAQDLVGCQDITWDIAGATAEFDLTSDEVEQVCDGVEAVCQRAPDLGLLRLFEVCYPAFQAGYWRLAEEATEDAAEAARIGAHAARYLQRLTDLARAPESAD